MENRAIEFAMEKRVDPVGYIERALQNDGPQCPPEVRARLTRRIAEHRSHQQSTQTLEPHNGACFVYLTPEAARVRALVAAL
jgi:hypothetical protein